MQLESELFGQLNLLEAHNWLFNCDIIPLCETNLNDTMEPPSNPLNDPNLQVEFFNNTILNVMSNFIPNGFYKNFKRKSCKPEDKEAVDNFRNECFNAINKANENYLTNLGKQLNGQKTGTKSYWNV